MFKIKQTILSVMAISFISLSAMADPNFTVQFTPATGSVPTKVSQLTNDLNLSPIGSVTIFAGTTPPTGWMFADGSSLDRTVYASLFTSIGTTYGTADATHFNLPDTRGIFVRGASQGASQTISGVSYSGTLGAKSYDQFQGHYHQATGNLMVAGQSSSGLNTGIAASSSYSKVGTLGDSSPNNSNNAISSPITGGNGAVRYGNETQPANISLNYIIRVN